MSTAIRSFSALTALIWAAACATPGYDLPAITDGSGTPRPGEFVWIDLVTDDVAAARSFYGALFSWDFAPGGDREYVEVRHRGRPIGGIALREDADPARGSAWVSSLSVEDLDEVAARVAAAGGRVEVGPVDVGDRGRAALVADPGGALFMLLQARRGDPPAAEAEAGEWLWRELWTLNGDEAVAFYRTVGGYEAVERDFRDTDYTVLERDGEPRAGILEDPRQQVDPLWLPYVRVSSAAEVARRAEELGARVVARSDDAAILVDPSGAAFGVQEWEGRR